MELTLLQSIIFGAVQGVTEFLPISSSGHIVLVQYFFGIDEPQIALVVALHVGSLLAVVIYFWRDWLNLLRIRNDMAVYQKNRYLLLYIVVATIPAMVFGFLFRDATESLVFSPIVTAFLIVVGSFVLFVADRVFSSEKSMEKISTKESLIIGFAQVLALIPGMSRSGITITGARACKLNRVDAARFSFLIATPIIAGAGIMQVGDVVVSELNVVILTGMITSFIAAIVTIHYFLVLIREISYAVFLYYSIGFFILVSIVFL